MAKLGLNAIVPRGGELRFHSVFLIMSGVDVFLLGHMPLHVAGDGYGD